MHPHICEVMGPVRIDLPWFKKCLTASLRENLKLEGEVAHLELVNKTLQVAAEEAIEARKQQIEGLRQLVEKDSERQQLALLTQLVPDDIITGDMWQQEKLKREDEVAVHRARDHTATEVAAALHCALQAERVEMAQLWQRLQDAHELAATASAASSSSELRAKIQGLEGELLRPPNPSSHPNKICRW
ncbi:hypothetical protein Vafri_11358 [Volvox africanus]|nr:hypothetical protein Vafri_11358 [Volvox africanus]